MPSLITANVKLLKDRLSSYLREVKAGAVVLVTDRGQVVAELRSPTVGALEAVESTSLYAVWVQDGSLIAPRVRPSELPRSPVRAPAGAADRVLDADRAE
jgi:antitoxin (DNA-binding transcriptional repressor) of toxin-antitoxin stability system